MDAKRLTDVAMKKASKLKELEEIQALEKEEIERLEFRLEQEKIAKEIVQREMKVSTTVPTFTSQCSSSQEVNSFSFQYTPTRIHTHTKTHNKNVSFRNRRNLNVTNEFVKRKKKSTESKKE